MPSEFKGAPRCGTVLRLTVESFARSACLAHLDEAADARCLVEARTPELQIKYHLVVVEVLGLRSLVRANAVDGDVRLDNALIVAPRLHFAGDAESSREVLNQIFGLQSDLAVRVPHKALQLVHARHGGRGGMNVCVHKWFRTLHRLDRHPHPGCHRRAHQRIVFVTSGVRRRLDHLFALSIKAVHISVAFLHNVAVVVGILFRLT